MTDFDYGTFVSSADRIEGERDRREQNAARTLSFGVHFLDCALGGIFPNDLVLIGAKTGVGKTQLATCIAKANASAGKNVHYFALEAEQDEIERRLKYSILAESAATAGYMDWYKCAFSDARDESAADDEIRRRYGTLHTFYRGKEFDGDKLEQMLLGIQDTTDLVIVDHLHYVDTDDANENRGYKKVVKQVRNAALSMGKPVILIAHLRKSDAKSDRIVPDIEDFHGTSDIAKISTKAIMLSPARDMPSGVGIWPTYIAPVKCRVDGSRTRYVGMVNYDSRAGMYVDEFLLGRIEKNEFNTLEESQTPRWAVQRGM